MRLAIATFLLVSAGALTAADSCNDGWKCYRYFEAPTKTVATVQVMWVDTEAEAAAKCGGNGSGCWRAGEPGTPDLIIAPRPRDFNDQRRLLILGHEFFHALGAKHD